MIRIFKTMITIPGILFLCLAMLSPFHNKEFPAGGDLYSFIWRIGSSIQYTLEDHNALIFGFRFMHVLNGQGATRDNPAYNAAGICLHVVRYF